MRVLWIASAVALAAGPASADKPAVEPAKCKRPDMVQAVRPGEPLKPRKLTDLPAAKAFSAVYRHVDGCEAPIVVSYKVGRSRH